MTLDRDTIEQLVAQYLKLWDRSDIDGILAMYSKDMSYHDMSSGEMVKYSDLKQFITDTFAHKEEQSIKLNDKTFIEGNTAFIYWTQSFIAMDTNRRVTIKGVELIVFRDGLIKSIHEFYESEGTPVDLPTSVESGTESEKMTKLGLTKEMMEQLAAELEDYFNTKRPYLAPELTLTTVAEHLGYTRNQISFVINHLLGRTFYDLVNTRRIDHALSKMSSPLHDLSILELGFDAGFNSVSGFYNAFRKQTNMTPAQYKRSIN